MNEHVREPGELEELEERSLGEAAPRSLEEAMERMSPATLAKLRLGKLAGLHALVWLLSLGLFAAADSWVLLSGLGVASLLSVIAGVLAGLVVANLIHEWFHFLGAKLSGGRYAIPDKLGLFVYDWHFDRNSTAQFFTMSAAGTVGGAVALVLVFTTIPADTLGRCAVHAGVVAGFVFAAIIEWPVLRRVRFGGDPLTELSKIDQRVLGTAFGGATVAGLLALFMLAP
jgi:hypothetical protein